MKKVSMIGCGKLGLICAEVMSSAGHEVFGYDINNFVSEKITRVHSIKEAVTGRDIVFIAVPTPHHPDYDGRSPTSHLEPKDFNYSIVTAVLEEVAQHVSSETIVVLISTVLPGTIRKNFLDLTENMQFVYNPYLIAMGTVETDMVKPEMVIIGTKDGEVSGPAQELIDFYQSFIDSPRYEVGTWEEAESIKIFYNTMISAKIGLVNMIQDVAMKLGNMDVDVVTNALAKSTMRITGPKYMIPGLGDSGGCVLPDFQIMINDKMMTIEEFFDSFNDETIFLTDSVNYAITEVDQKKIHHPTRREYDGDILRLTTASGRQLTCTTDHIIPVRRKGVRVLIRAEEIQLDDELYLTR